jgi:splicing factor 3B subunit 3
MWGLRVGSLRCVDFRKNFGTFRVGKSRAFAMSSLLHVSLSKSGACVLSAFGDFTGRGDNSELLIVRPGALELYNIDDTGKLNCINVTPIFAVVRSASVVRPKFLGRDAVLLGSDSGYISESYYELSIKGWKIIATAGYGRAGCLKDTPGQYLAGCKHGGSVMVASVESQFAVFRLSELSVPTDASTTAGEGMEIDILNFSHELKVLPYSLSPGCPDRIQAGSPTASPCVMFDLCALDTGDSNDTYFAAIEASPCAAKGIEKNLVVYRLDASNKTIHRASYAAEREANILIPLPSSKQSSAFNGGVIICGVGLLSLHIPDKNVIMSAKLPIEDDLIVCGAAHLLTSAGHDGGNLLVLLQGESGTLYRAMFSTASGTSNLSVSIFECASSVNIYSSEAIDSAVNTLPRCRSIAISKSGLLFCAGESGAQNLYAISSLGAHDGIAKDKLQSLRLVDTLNSLNSVNNMSNHHVGPILDMFCDDLLDIYTPQLYTLCGNGGSNSASANTSHLCISKKGCTVQSLGATLLRNLKPLPLGEKHVPTGMWTIPNSYSEKSVYDRFVVISFATSTLLLAIHAETGTVTPYQPPIGGATDPSDPGALRFQAISSQCRTLHCCLLADNALLQVHPNGLTHISADGQEVSQWEVPQEYLHTRIIEHVSCNGRQLAISLCASSIDTAGIAQVMRGNGGGGNEIVYFELDDSKGQLVDCGTIPLDAKEVSCFDVGEVTVAHGSPALSKYLAIGFWDETVQLISLDNAKPAEYLKQRASCSFSNRPSSLCFFTTSTALYLNVGCVNGELTRLKLATNAAAGSNILSVASQQLLTSALQTEQQVPVTLTRIRVNGSTGKKLSAVIAASALTLLMHPTDTDQIVDTLIPIRPFECCCSVAFQRGIDFSFNLLTLTEGNFEVLSLRDYAFMSTSASANFGSIQIFSHSHVPLKCTPRKMSPIIITNPKGRNKGLVVVAQAECKSSTWESHISLVDPCLSGEAAVSDTFTFESNCAALSLCVINHSGGSGPKAGKEKNAIVIVGTATNMDVTTGLGSSYALHSFTTRHNKETGKITLLLLHTLSLDALPRSLCSFDPADNDEPEMRQGGRYAYLLVGASYKLLAFEINKNASLAKRCEYSLGTKNSIASDVKSERDRDTWGHNPRNFQTISRIAVHGSRIFVGDSTNSVTFVKYIRSENRFVGYADDRESPRFVSALIALDTDSVACGDRFGNLCTLQIPEGMENDIDAQSSYDIDDGFGHARATSIEEEDAVEAKPFNKKRPAVKDAAKEKVTKPKLSSHRVSNNESLLKSQFYLGESVTAMCTTRSQMFTGHQTNSTYNQSGEFNIKVGRRGYFNNSGSILLVGTIEGGMSAFVPLRDEPANFYHNLESCIRRSTCANSDDVPASASASASDELIHDYNASSTIAGGLCVRHHQSYRSYFHPTKGTVDGDLLLTFKTMSKSQQIDIAKNLSKILSTSENDSVSAFQINPQQITDRIDSTIANII